jgi:hypothetical protein
MSCSKEKSQNERVCCLECHQEFSKYGFVSHYWMSHTEKGRHHAKVNSQLGLQKANSTTRVVVCSKCGQSFKAKGHHWHFRHCNGNLPKNNKDYVKIENGNYQCLICGEEYSPHGIGTHIWRRHTKAGQTHNPVGAVGHTPWNKGLTKETSEKIKQHAEQMSVYFSKNPTFKGVNHTEKTKKKISKGMKLAHSEGRANHIKYNKQGKPSNLEEFFVRGMHWTFDDLDYITECLVQLDNHPYWLDFVWVHKRKVIEIDGSQHENAYHKKRDPVRDYKVKAILNWDTLRIKGKDLRFMPAEWYEYAKKFLETRWRI